LDPGQAADRRLWTRLSLISFFSSAARAVECDGEVLSMSTENIVIIVVIILIVLFVLGYFGRGRLGR
jgi:hypothetical protein